MKNVILLISFLFSAVSFAQRPVFGVSAGLTNYRISGQAAGNLDQLLDFSNDLIKMQPVTGFYAGGFAEIPVGGVLSIEPGLYYSGKGYQMAGSYSVKGLEILNATATARLQTDYIELPLLVKATLKGFQVFAGPRLSYLSNAGLHMAAGFAGFDIFNNKSDVTSLFNRWDPGVTGGVGYQFANGIRITATYDRGLSKIDAGQATKSYNQGFLFGAGMKF